MDKFKTHEYVFMRRRRRSRRKKIENKFEKSTSHENRIEGGTHNTYAVVQSRIVCVAFTCDYVIVIIFTLYAWLMIVRDVN